MKSTQEIIRFKLKIILASIADTEWYFAEIF